MTERNLYIWMYVAALVASDVLARLTNPSLGSFERFVVITLFFVALMTASIADRVIADD